MKLTVLGCLLASAGAHVSLQYQSGYPAGVRNANGPTGNGRASVAGGCGGVNDHGTNGVGQISDGDSMTLNINYAAGHASAQNAFRMAYSCTGSTGPNNKGTTQSGIEDASSTLTVANNDCTATGGTGPYTDDGVNGNTGVPAPNAIVQGGYTVTCQLPKQDNAEPLECTVALIDQRNWGGCVDLSVLPAAAALPPSPPPAPYQSNAGKYNIISANSVDGSGPTFSNCDFSAGYLDVPSYDKDAPSFQARLNTQANECRATPEPSDPTTGISMPRDTTILVDMEFTMSLDSATGVYSGIANIQYDATDSSKTQPYMFSVGAQAMDFAYSNPNNPEEQPIVNDGFSNPNVQGISIGGSDGGMSGAGIAMLVIIILLVLVLGVGFYCYKKRTSSGGAPPAKAATGTQYGAAYGQGGVPPPPPPPGPPPASLPAGWVEMKDPNSGQTYYHNASMQQTQWERPEGRLTGRV